MSERKEAAKRIAQFIIESKLAQPYGGDVEQDSSLKGKPYTVGFSYPRYVDGYVVVYSPSWILVEFQTAYRDLPPKDRVVFESVENAIAFIKLAFVEVNGEEAMKVPQKAKRNKQ